MSRQMPRWTPEEWKLAQTLRGQELGFDDIAVRLGRTGKAVRAKFAKENLTAEQRQQRANYLRSKREAQIKTRQISGMTFMRVQPRETVAAFTERNHRLSLAPRDLTAAIFGDPLPGYSALDRRAVR